MQEILEMVGLELARRVPDMTKTILEAAISEAVDKIIAEAE